MRDETKSLSLYHFDHIGTCYVVYGVRPFLVALTSTGNKFREFTATGICGSMFLKDVDLPQREYY
jgi:hypothetical protein